MKKDSDRSITPAMEAIPANVAPPGSLQTKQLHHLHAQFLLGQNCHRQKMSCVYALRVTMVLSDSATLETVACQTSLSEWGFSRQEYWSILANTGCHTLLEHGISCCLSCCPPTPPPRVPGAVRTPATQAAALPPHLAPTGANPSPPGQPQELNPSG